MLDIISVTYLVTEYLDYDELLYAIYKVYNTSVRNT